MGIVAARLNLSPMFISGLAILVAIYLLIMVILVIRKHDTSFGNFSWGGGVLLVTLYSFFVSSSYLPRQILVSVLVLLWGIRLGVYFYSRYKKGKDQRYISWSQRWGIWSIPFTVVWVFVLNGLFLLIMSLPSIMVNTQKSGQLTIVDAFGFLLWVIGFYFESMSDYQLHWFMQNPENKGKIMEEGLWKYSRHPNYFGEITMWWGIFIILLSVPYGYLTIITPLAISTTLIFFTGIPWNEQVFKDNPEYEKYKKRTNMLIPWWPR